MKSANWWIRFHEWLAPMTVRRLTKAEAGYERLTSIHEAAHSCVSIALRFPFRKVDIIPRENRSGRMYVRRKRKSVFVKNGHNDAARGKLWCERTERNFIDRCERKIIVDFAGGIAQRRYAPRSNWLYGMGHDGLVKQELYYDVPVITYHVKVGCGSDLDNIDAALRALKRHGDTAYRAELEARSKALVKKLFPEIQIVARALLKKKVLTQAEVRRLMNRARR